VLDTGRNSDQVLQNTSVLGPIYHTKENYCFVINCCYYYFGLTWSIQWFQNWCQHWWLVINTRKHRIWNHPLTIYITKIKLADCSCWFPAPMTNTTTELFRYRHQEGGTDWGAAHSWSSRRLWMCPISTLYWRMKPGKKTSKTINFLTLNLPCQEFQIIRSVKNSHIEILQIFDPN
jgi:hypothetical protein